MHHPSLLFLWCRNKPTLKTITVMASKDFQIKLMSLQGNLLNYAFMLTSSREEAYSLLNHTTEAALEQWATAADDVHFKGWTFSIMRSLFAGEFSARAKARRATRNDVYALRLTDETGDCADSALLGTYRSTEVTRALSSFTIGYRRTIELHFSGYSCLEIARELNLTVAVVKSRVAYCCNRLRAQLSA